MTSTQLAALAVPFAPDEIHWRVGTVGKQRPGKPRRCTLLAYIDARAAMDRLDAVAGPGGWQDKYRPGADGGLLCSIGLSIGGEWVWKEDGAENTQVEAVKGGMSDAFKRAAVKWGIGRYLYRLDADWHTIQDGWANGRGIDVSVRGEGHVGWCATPQLPAFALPPGTPAEVSTRTGDAQRQGPAGKVHRWTEQQQRGWFAFLNEQGIDYEALAAWCQSKGKPRPSGMQEEARQRLASWLMDPKQEALRASLRGGA